jgi:hypothetical protein
MPPSSGPQAWVNAVPPGWVRMTPEDDTDVAVRVELGDPFPQVTQGVGGWNIIDRPGRTGITHWTGHEPYGVDLELFFDDPDGSSVEAPLACLEAMAGRGTKRKGDEPPVLKVDSAGVMPHDLHGDPGTRWVIAGIDYSTDEVLVNSAGNRYRQTVTVSLLQFVADERLSSLSANQFLTRKPAKKRYRVKTGDTLVTIAAKQLGDPSRWNDIAKLNNLRDPRSIRQGALLRMP